MKCLLILGGLYKGDCCHVIPMLNRLVSDGFTSITWIHGTFASDVVEYIATEYPITQRLVLNDGHPQDFNSRVQFKERAYKVYRHLIENGGFDKIVDDHLCTFESIGCNDVVYSWGKGYNLDETYVGKVKQCGWTKNKVVIQYDTMHTFKSVPQLKCVNFNQFGFDEIVCVGREGEYVYPGGINLLGHPFEEVAKEIETARLFVGIHSACTCLAFYIGTNSIFCHPHTGMFPFNRYHENQIDLPAPTTAEIESKIWEKINATK